MKPRISTFLSASILLILVGLFSSQAARAVPVFFADFEYNTGGPPPEFSGAGAVGGTQGYPGPVPAFGDWFLFSKIHGNPAPATTLTLAGLPSHTSVDLSFLLAIIDSWDGNTHSSALAPDFFNVTVDSVSVFSETFDAFDLGDQTFGDAPLTWGSDLAVTPWPDAAYAMSLTGIPHTASTLTVDFFASGAGWQGGWDKSWAIDNVSVTVSGVGDPIPEPGTLLLLGSGLAGLAGFGRKRLSRKA